MLARLAVATLAAILYSAPSAGAACPVVLDVRSKGEFDAGHASCAYRIEHADSDFLSQVLSWAGSDKDRDIQVYCASGNRAGVAKGKLESDGFTSVTNAGGFSASLESSLCGDASCPAPSLLDDPDHGGESESTPGQDTRVCALASATTTTKYQLGTVVLLHLLSTHLFSTKSHAWPLLVYLRHRFRRVGRCNDRAWEFRNGAGAVVRHLRCWGIAHGDLDKYLQHLNLE